MDDLISLLVFGALILFSLLGGGKRRSRQQAQPGQPPPARPRPPRAEPLERAGVPERNAPAEPSLQDLLSILQGRVPERATVVERVLPSEPELPEARSLEEYVREDRSIETLEAAGGASHVAFHERYLSDAPEAAQRRPSRFRRISPRTARDAVIWKTIFETPKGLQ